MASGDVAYDLQATASSLLEQAGGAHGSHVAVLQGTVTAGGPSGGTTYHVKVTIEMDKLDSLIEFGKNYTVSISET